MDKQGNLSPEVKHLFLLHKEKVISAREAIAASERQGSAMLSPKHFQLLQLGWVMQVSSSAHMQTIYLVPKNCFWTSTATASLKKSSPAGQVHLPTIYNRSLASKAFSSNIKETPIWEYFDLSDSEAYLWMGGLGETNEDIRAFVYFFKMTEKKKLNCLRTQNI